MQTTRAKFFYAALVVFAGILSVGLSEVTMVTWLSNVGFDATGDFFWTALLPVQLIVVAITTTLLFKVYARQPRLYLPLYAVVFICTHTLELKLLLNPWADVALYISAIVIACAVWFALLWQVMLKKRG